MNIFWDWVARGIAFLLGKFGRLLLASAVTLTWFVAFLVVGAIFGRSLTATVLVVVCFLIAAVASFLWLPQLMPGVSDWKRFKRRKANRQARVAGYHHAAAMSLIAPLDAETLEWAMKNPVRRLPDARLVVTPETVSLFAQQTVAATDDTLQTKAEAYAPVLNCSPDWVRVERISAQTVRLVFPRVAPVDRLAVAIPFPEPGHPFPRTNAATDPVAPLVIGRQDSGADFCLNLADRQTLVLGSSGSGKGSVVWSVMLALAPHIDRGTVRVIGVDLKGGVELITGEPLFDSIATTFEQAAAALGELRAEVDRRLEYMVSVGSRKHEPTTEQPAILLLLDEYSSLVYTAPDNKAKTAIESDLKRVLSTGRAARINVLALAQDPRADSILARSLFTSVVGLRFRTKDDATLALGASTYDAGAHCDKIPQSQPGTGYMVDGETGAVVRFRAFWCDDQAIKDAARQYRKMPPYKLDIPA